MADTSSGTKTRSKERVKTKKPKMYRVVLLNDDYTTMDFVVSILESIFQKSPAEAVQIMLKVHTSGRGVCGVYPREIAEAKVELVHSRARAAGYPLACQIEEA
ncbi:MAG: ATP-dependent Clp protease adapter ClpS [Candidatus Dadabacteria bacterium]|nr:MAG: ATP-dependent Clp protease adapter ClpS [Candidatus Dadabacteria bacterium]